MKQAKYLIYISWLILCAGILLRLVLYLQPHDLNIDEANVMRNLAERSFTGLLQPLSYYQYAPPVFLWMEKLSVLCCGLGEKAGWLYPLLCGIASLFVLHRILALLLPVQSRWLPLAVFSFGIIYIKYSVQVKQYMPDTLVSLLLVLLALTIQISRTNKQRFFLLWLVAGSLAIWSSMPAVFTLAGIGGYYGILMLQERKKAYLPLLTGLAAVWALQFYLYYHFMLSSQIHSAYLQNFHQPYFLFALPRTMAAWNHNADRLLNVFGAAVGYTGVAIAAHLVFFLAGIIRLIRRQLHIAILLLLPVLLVIIAAALHQFSLIERVILFMMPLMLIVIGFGFDWLLQLPLRAARPICTIAAIIAVSGYQMFSLLWSKYQFQEITPGLNYLVSHQAKGRQLYVHNATTDTYIYYTQLHPQRSRWQSLQGAHLLTWDTDYSQLPVAQNDTAYVLYTGIDHSELDMRRQGLLSFLQPTVVFEPQSRNGEIVCYVNGYVRR